MKESESGMVLQGYYGCAIGKAKQNAKTEIEKLKVGHHVLTAVYL